MARSSAARARSSSLFSTASSALRIHSACSPRSPCLLREQVLIGDRDRHLRLDLQQLVLHVEDHLLDHLLGIFRLSIRSFRFARTSVATRSSSAMIVLLFVISRQVSGLRATSSASIGLLVADASAPSTSRSDICMPESASKSAGTCAAIFGHVAGDLVRAGGVAVAGRDDGDLVDLARAAPPARGRPPAGR